jgi:hypothetical protein
MTLPEVLARPPWPPKRVRAVLSLEFPAREDRIVWAEGEQHAWAHPGGGVDKKLEPWEREEILTKLEIKDIVRIDAATNLEKSDLLKALLRCDKRFIEHYGLARVALAKYGLEVLDAMFDLARLAPSCGLEVLLRVDSLRVPRELAHDEEMLAQWSARHPLTAALAVLPDALGPEGKSRKATLKTIARMRKDGHEAALREAARIYGEDAVVEVDALLAPEPLPSRGPALPAFVDLAALPMPRTKTGETIGDEARERLVQLLSLLPLGAAQQAIASVKDALDAESLAALGGKLADAWVASGADTKHKWALLAAGALGDDIVARSLADWTIEWAKAGVHPRSRVALEALSIVGTDVALMHTDRIARTMKGALKANATATLEAIAKARNLSQEQLADRLVPSLGLDPSGSTWLDFGARRFRVSFDEGLVPELEGEDGTRLPRLPRATKHDDEAKATRAIATFKGFTSDAKKIAPDQVRRLERAMCTERAWSAAELRRFFVEHPLMVHLARRLVWVTDTNVTFRVTEDRTLAGRDDREFALEEGAHVRIAHPIVIGQGVGAWSTLFTDYLLVQPFPQLGRETYALRDDEKTSHEIARFEGRAIAGNRFFSLKHRGWDFHDYAIGKVLRGGFMAMLESEPGLEFLSARPEDQTLGKLLLRRERGATATFGELSAIDASELLRDVDLLGK